MLQGKKRRYFRTVVEGPADFNPPGKSVTLAIMRRSWTGRIHTVRFWSDVNRTMVKTGLRVKDGVTSFDELERLYLLGFKVEKQLKREVESFRPPGRSIAKCSNVWRGRVAQTIKTAREVFPDHESK